MKDEAGDVAIRECFGLKPKMYSFSLDDTSEHKKQKVRIKMLKKYLTSNK